MGADSGLLRSRDTDALRAELRRIRSLADVPIMFGGEVHDDTLVLTEFVGARTNGLRGLAVRPNSGLGGAAVVGLRPMSVPDYRNAAWITHDYDRPVIGEGIRSVLAVPVVVAGRARAVLYGAYRDIAPVGDRTADLVFTAARRLAHEFRVRDEADRLMRFREAQLANPGDHTVSIELIREVYTELRRLAADRAAAGVGGRLSALADQLAVALSGDTPSSEVSLTPRELDVLSQVALGCTNAEAAERLSVRPETVKSYLRAATAKLGAHSRHEAVSKARRAGLIP